MSGTFDWAHLSTIAVREAVRVGLAHHDAQDAAQEALIRAWRKRRQCRDGSDGAAWVASIGRREAYRLAVGRREVPVDPADLPDDTPGPEESEPRLDVRRALSTLRPADRLVLLLRHECDLTHADIARVIGSGEAASAIRLHRAHRRLLHAVQSGDVHDFKDR